MAKRNKSAAPAVEQSAAPVEQSQAPRVARLRLPLEQARAHNVQFVPVDPAAVTAANVALTSKGTNPKKARVYGYDNLSNGGGVPKTHKVAIVEGAVNPKGVNPAQFELLVANPGHTVIELRGLGITSRTIRRAYRAGAIRFVA
jgi:hypothetical protein